jgi:hypothetical protein
MHEELSSQTPMPGITFDTTAFVSHKPADFPAGFLMSA